MFTDATRAKQGTTGAELQTMYVSWCWQPTHPFALERFGAKLASDLIRGRLPVRAKRQNRGIELRSDSIGTETALGGFESTTVAGLILSLSSAEVRN